MSRVKAAIDDKDYDLALKLLDAIIDIKPDYVEAWNRRATIYYLNKDYGHALADIREVLAREPRHFGALSGLGMILQDIGDDKHALEAFRRALADRSASREDPGHGEDADREGRGPGYLIRPIAAICTRSSVARPSRRTRSASCWWRRACRAARRRR